MLSPLHSPLIQTKVEDPTSSRATPPQGWSRSGHSISRFVRHYVEMVAVMFLGMFALAMPAEWLLRALGTSSSSSHPAMMLLSMGVTMTAPMIAWMRYRGHSWRANIEMAASMVLPTFAVIGLLWTGLVTGTGTLMVIDHVAMLGGMLLAMVRRLDEYAGAAHSHGAARPAIAA